MLLIDNEIDVKKLSTKLPNFWNLSGQKVLTIEQHYDHSKGSPVFTEAGKYTTRGWTEWTQGFQYGAAILQFDATNDPQFLEIGRKHTVKSMATHISHIGVHDHGFNNVGSNWTPGKKSFTSWLSKCPVQSRPPDGHPSNRADISIRLMEPIHYL